jgi:hypothetical protein
MNLARRVNRCARSFGKTSQGLGYRRRSMAARPPHPDPNVRDDRDTPLLTGTGTRNALKLFPLNREAKFFWKEGWTGESLHGGSDKLEWLERKLVMAR